MWALRPTQEMHGDIRNLSEFTWSRHDCQYLKVEVLTSLSHSITVLPNVCLISFTADASICGMTPNSCFYWCFFVVEIAPVYLRVVRWLDCHCLSWVPCPSYKCLPILVLCVFCLTDWDLFSFWFVLELEKVLICRECERQFSHLHCCNTAH